MKKSILTVLLLAVISPMVLLAGSTTYSYSATLNVSSSGNGKVYASDSSTNAGSTQTVTKSESSGDDSKSFTLYAHAVADEGYEFSKWSDGTTGNPQAVSFSLTSSSSSATKNLTATFVKKALPEFSVTFSAPIGGGYTVNGTQVSSDYSLTQTEALETTLVAAPSAGNRFYGWYTLNGNAKEYFSYSASVSKSFPSTVTVGADFISESDVVKVATFAEADAAMSSDAKIVEITSGTTLIVPSGSTLTVPDGKILSVEGKLAVAGTLSILGVVSGDGKVYKISREIKQGDAITPLNGIGDACGKQYRKTEVVSYSPSVTGNVLCGQIWGVLLNGTSVASMQQESPKALKVVLNTSSEVNTISSVVENGDVSGDITASGSYILLQDCTVSGPIIRVSDKYDRLNFQGTIDCAGRKVSATFKQFNSGFNAVCLNGSVNFDPSEYNQGGCAQFYNCSSFNLKRLKGKSCKFDFYDCGTASSPVTISLNYYSNLFPSTSPTTENYGNFYFYSGYYDYNFSSTSTAYCHVYGGSFTSDATGYIPTDLRNDPQNPYAAIYDGSKYYVVQVVKPAEMTVSVGGKEYETLDEALAAATDGATVTLIAGVDLTGKTVTNTKNITLDLGRSQIVGGKIINNGTMLITDVSSDNESIVGCDVENNGTLDFVFGTYNGAITCKAGTLTVHNGKFNGVFSREGGTVDLKGGNFKTDISSLITAGGYKVFTKDSYYCPCEMPNGEFVATTLSGLAGYSVTPYVPSDFALLRRHAQGESSRTDYTTSDWARVAELLTTYHALYSYGLDPTLIFDRPVTKESLELSVSSGSTPQSSDFYSSVEKDQPYRALTEFLMHGAPLGPYSAKTYRDIATEEIGTVAVSVADGSSGMNAGTVCTLQIELWQGVRAPDYSSTGRYVTNTVDVLGETRFTIGAGSNKAMIRPETGAATFYAKLADAVTASNGGTVLLAADSTEAETITLPAAGTYIIDPYGFAYANKTVVVAKGLELVSALEIDSAYAASQQKAVVYTVIEKVQVQIGDSYFATLAAAIKAAKAGDTIKLLANVGTDAALVINKELTVDLNGKTIAATENDKVGDGVFCVVAGGELTINDSLGTGVIDGVGDNDYNIAIWANGGKVIINGGNFTNVGATDKTDPNAHFDLIYAKNGGEVIINGGSFECETPEFTLNSHDTYKGNITVNGGTFVDFDPRNNAAETSGTTFMAAGKYTFAEGGNYIVVTPESYVLNGVASNSAVVDKIDAALAGAVKITKVDGAYVATAEYSFEIKDVDILNPANSKYELTGGTLRPGRTVAVKYYDLATGETSYDKFDSDTVTFKLVID